MNEKPLLPWVIDLMDEILALPIDVEADVKPDTHPLVVVYYAFQSRASLRAVRHIASDEMFWPTIVLVRHLFELGVGLRYMLNDIPNRVPEYLKHGEDVDQRRTWANLKDMCVELGLVDFYDQMYRHSSQVAHGGGQRMYLELFRLSGRDAPKEWELPGVLETGLLCYSWILHLHYQAFPPSTEVKLAFDQWVKNRDHFRDALSRVIEADGGSG